MCPMWWVANKVVLQNHWQMANYTTVGGVARPGLPQMLNLCFCSNLRCMNILTVIIWTMLKLEPLSFLNLKLSIWSLLSWLKTNLTQWKMRRAKEGESEMSVDYFFLVSFLKANVFYKGVTLCPSLLVYNWFLRGDNWVPDTYSTCFWFSQLASVKFK